MHFSCPITNKVVEENKIKQILHNDQYKTDNKDLKSKKPNKEDSTSTEIRNLTKLFKNANAIKDR
jgi:hypothetical protein